MYRLKKRYIFSRTRESPSSASFGLSASAPVVLSASAPVGLSASVPVGQPASAPVGPSASAPVGLPSSAPVGQPADSTTARDVSLIVKSATALHRTDIDRADSQVHLFTVVKYSSFLVLDAFASIPQFLLLFFTIDKVLYSVFNSYFEPDRA